MVWPAAAAAKQMAEETPRHSSRQSIGSSSNRQPGVVLPSAAAAVTFAGGPAAASHLAPLVPPPLLAPLPLIAITIICLSCSPGTPAATTACDWLHQGRVLLAPAGRRHLWHGVLQVHGGSVDVGAGVRQWGGLGPFHTCRQVLACRGWARCANTATPEP